MAGAAQELEPEAAARALEAAGPGREAEVPERVPAAVAREPEAAEPAPAVEPEQPERARGLESFRLHRHKPTTPLRATGTSHTRAHAAFRWFSALIGKVMARNLRVR